MNIGNVNAFLSGAFSLLIVVFSVYACLNADASFSLDYSTYIYYNQSLRLLKFALLNRSLIDHLPLPYVLIPPSVTVEYGYAALTAMLISLGLSAAGTYAVIASFSIAARAYVLQKARAGLFLNVLLTMSFITLFEANALRAGAASSLVLLGLVLFLRQRYVWAATMVALSFLMHVQSIVYFMTLLAGYGIYVLTTGRPYIRSLLLLLGTALTFVAVPVIGGFFGNKAGDYMLRASSDNHATGINSLSILSLLLIAASMYAAPKVAKTTKGAYPIAWISSLFAFSQATIFLIFGGAYADIGVRLWQFAFLIFSVASIFLNTRLENGSVQAKRLDYSIKCIYLCAAVVAANVIFRYPLSNFFYPIVPYTLFDYITY